MQTSWGYSTLTFGDWQRRHHLEQQGILYFSQMIFFTNHFIYILKNKGKCFSKFKDFQAFIKNQIGEKTKILRNDNEREFASDEFHEFLKLHGI